MHFHVTINRRTTSWAWIAARRAEADTIARRYRNRTARGIRRSLAGLVDVESCKDVGCPLYREYLSHVAGVAPVTM